MRPSVQTLESIQADFDRIALLSNDNWNHNVHYHDYLICQLPERCQQVLEIGCGTGRFSRLLAQRCEKLIAIDLAPQMIRLAQECSKEYLNIEFVLRDVMAYDFPANQFDCIATLTTLHHLPTEIMLRRIREALKPGGVFVCLDLYQRSSLSDLLFDCVAYPSNFCLRLIKTGKLRESRQVREAYAEHGKTDRYLTLSQIEQFCTAILPGALVRRHLLWRYSIIWKKENEA